MRGVAASGGGVPVGRRLVHKHEGTSRHNSFYCSLQEKEERVLTTWFRSLVNRFSSVFLFSLCSVHFFAGAPSIHVRNRER